MTLATNPYGMPPGTVLLGSRLLRPLFLRLLFLFSACLVPPVMAETGGKVLDHYHNPALQTYAGGQPSPDQLRALAEAGVQHVINLRPRAEQGGFDEADAVTAAGMQYHHLPIAGGRDINFDNAAKLDRLLSQTADQTVLLHCASGNRVGALIALRASMAGVENEAAIAEGKRWGLTGLESLVRQRLGAAEAAGEASEQ